MQLIGGSRREVGKTMSLEVAPDILRWVEFGGVRRQRHQLKARVTGHKALHFDRAMRLQPVPDHYDWAWDVEQDLLQESHAGG